MMRLLDTHSLKTRARRLRSETFALYLAARHKDTPWFAKLFAAAIAAYAFSPIDLIPDFIPVLGYLDDLLIVPAGIVIAVRLVPPAVMEQCREQAAEAFAEGSPVSAAAATVVVVIWIALFAMLATWAFRD